MTEEPFQPRNDLESQLLAAQEGRLSGEEFMTRLLGSQVFMPVRETHPIGGFQASDKAVPLSLTSEDGTEVLVLFTSPERAKPFVQDHPAYQGGLLAEFRWVLEKMGDGVGIALNPGWAVGIDMAPGMVRQLLND